MPQRQRIINELNSHINIAYLSRTLTKQESAELREYVRNTLSLEILLGFRQTSIFDDISNDLFKEPDKHK